MRSRKIHIALHVGDLRQSVEFYRAVFAAEPVRVREGYAKFDIVEPPLNLALNEAASEKGDAAPSSLGVLSHLGIEVASTEDVIAMRERLEVAGLTTRDEMQTECCHALQDKIWVHDPDGNAWEIFVVLGDVVLGEPSRSADPCCGTRAGLPEDEASEQDGAAAAELPAKAPCCGSEQATGEEKPAATDDRRRTRQETKSRILADACC